MSYAKTAAPPERGRRARVWRMAVSGVLNVPAPLAAYALVRPHTGSDATALTVAAGIPVLYTVATFAVRRRIDAIGVIAVLAYGVALLALLLSGGNPLVLKLHEAVLTGPLGLAGLVSVVVGRPLYLVVLRRLAARNPRAADMVRRPDIRRVASVLTTIIGGTLAVHALVMLLLALRLPTATYLALSRPIGWALMATGLVAVLWYRSRLRAAST